MDRGCIAMPGAFSGLCARAIAAAGFDACYVSGAATSALAGVPDVGVLGLEHFCRTIREVSDGARREDGTRLPVLADADTGFGEAEMVRRTVIEYERAGAAGLHIEDQEFPKRCGHLDGKRLVPVDHMVEKIEWAVRARSVSDGSGLGGAEETPRRRDGETKARMPSLSESVGGASEGSDVGGTRRGFIVCARTDARGVEGIDTAIARAHAYVAAGADMIFPEGLTSEDEFARFASSLHLSVSSSPRPYLLANMTEFGKTPIIPLERFAALGYSCVIYPVSLLRVAMGAAARAAAALRKDGSVARLLDQMQTRQELYGLLGYAPGKPWEWPRE